MRRLLESERLARQRARCRNYYVKHREERVLAAMEWARLHPEERKISQRRYEKKYQQTTKYRKMSRENAWRSAGIQISFEEYQDLLQAQGYRCGICVTHVKDLQRNLGVDHDHESGKIRGLLCFDCNTALGKLKDSPDLVAKALVWLGRAK